MLDLFEQLFRHLAEALVALLAAGVLVLLPHCVPTASTRQHQPPYTAERAREAKAADPYEQRHYSMDDKPTARQIQIMRDLFEQAPQWWDEDMEAVAAGGDWPSTRLFEAITHGEVALDRMQERYGVLFKMAPVNSDTVNYVDEKYREYPMVATEGPLAGQECSYRYLSPDQARGMTEESDTYIDLLRQEEYTDYVLKAVNKAFDKHPSMHGSFAVTRTGNDGLWDEMPKPTAPLKQLLPFFSARIDIYISPISLVGKAGYDAFSDDLARALATLKTDTDYTLVYVTRVPKAYEGQPFSFEAGVAADDAESRTGVKMTKWKTRVSVTEDGKVYGDDDED